VNQGSPTNREPMRPIVRRTFVRVARRILLVVGVVMMTVLGSPVVLAQTSTTTLVLDAGYGGYIDPLDGFDLFATVSSSELFTGRLEVNVAGVSAAVEIPAGGTKTVTLRIPPIGEQRRLTVRLVDTSGEAAQVAVSETMQTLTPGDAVLVATVGTLDLGSARSFPLQRDIFTVGEQSSGFSRLNSAVSYVVAADGKLTDLSDDDRSALVSWVTQGGVLIASQRDVAALGDQFAGGIIDEAFVAPGRIVVADVGSLSAGSWDRVFIDTPSVGTVVSYTEQGFGSLDAAAASARPLSVPALPWLVSGIAMFVLLVGPVNFLVLRRTGKPELAWVTIPAASVVFFLAFLFVAQQSVEAEIYTSAVALYQSDGGVVGDGAVVVSAKAGRTVSLESSEEWAVAPSAGGFIGTVPAQQNGNSSVSFEFSEAGVGSAQLTPGDLPPTIGLSVVESDGSYTVTNDSEATLWVWGVVVGGKFAGSGDPLGPGESAAVNNRLASLEDWSILNQVVDRSGVEIWNMPNSEFRWRQIETLSPALESLAPLRSASKAFVFGVSNDYVIEMSVDGGRQAIVGVAVLVAEFDAANLGSGGGGAMPELVRALGAEFVEKNLSTYYIYGAEEVVVRFAVPDTVTAAKVVNPVGNPEVYNWGTDTWDPVTRGAEIAMDAYRGPDGYVLARVVGQIAEEMGGLGSQQGFRLDWVNGS
jgi:hypothetical protein